MRIGIVTQPLCSNYGGILQNLALQTVIKDLGHTPITLDLRTHLNISPIGYVRYCLSTLIKNLIKGERKHLLSYIQKRPKLFDLFVSKYICTTDVISEYTERLIDIYHLDCLIVGSDQVWRPRYNIYIEDMYLSFAEHRSLKKIVYAASFGVDNWEYSEALTERCRELSTLFNGVSVREESGIRLCKDFLNVKAQWVLDPTLLMSSDYYNSLCSDVPRINERIITVYALNISSQMKRSIYSFAERKGMKVKLFTSDADYSLSVPEWISVFRDASLVITDSFHGTVFSIIYQKDFIALNNSTRGASRLQSLLSRFGLMDRLIEKDNLFFSSAFSSIDWKHVDDILEKSRHESIRFLTASIQE